VNDTPFFGFVGATIDPTFLRPILSFLAIANPLIYFFKKHRFLIFGPDGVAGFTKLILYASITYKQF
jgi:hypothetical protein